jgi:hypothetical protein
MQLSRQSQNRPAYTFLCRMTVIPKPVRVRLEVPFQFLKEDRRPDSGWGSYHTRLLVLTSLIHAAYCTRDERCAGSLVLVL